MIVRRLPLLLLAGALALAFAAAPAAASDESDVMATVNQFINGFNKGDVKSMVATCASPVSVIDDFPPHAWQGATACSDWWVAFQADAKNQGITAAVVTLKKPLHDEVSMDRAYVVVPALYAYKDHGKPATQPGIMTLALKKSAGSWRITGWAWANQ